jgi:hypothetical protein
MLRCDPNFGTESFFGNLRNQVFDFSHVCVPRVCAERWSSSILAFGWIAFVRAGEYNVGMNAARYFQRREDYQPPQTPRDSPFRQLTVRCLKCGSYSLALAVQFDDAAGEMVLILSCPRCHQHERLRVEHC